MPKHVPTFLWAFDQTDLHSSMLIAPPKNPAQAFTKFPPLGPRALAILAFHQPLLCPRQEIQCGSHTAARAAEGRQSQCLPKRRPQAGAVTWIESSALQTCGAVGCPNSFCLLWLSLLLHGISKQLCSQSRKQLYSQC